MSSNLKAKIESILITEITKLYEKAASPLGLTIDDVKKLEVLVKIKDLERDDKADPVKAEITADIETLMKIARGTPTTVTES